MKPSKITLLVAASIAGAMITASAATVSASASSGAKPPREPEAPAAPEPPTPPTKPIPPGAESQVAKAAAEVQLKAAQVALERAGAVGGFGYASTTGKPKRAVVIPGAGGSPKDINGLQDDLAVMYKILEKAVSPEQRRSSAMGIWVFPGRTEHSNMYLDGYGAIFFLNANYPLAASTTENENDKQQGVSSEWEQTKREMSEPQISELSFELGATGGRTEEFKPEKVEELKARVVYALTNATHIKELKGDEYVTVIVTGSSGVTAKKGAPRPAKAQPRTGSPGKGPEESQLIFRVKRRDLEAVENGRMTPEALRHNVTITLL